MARHISNLAILPCHNPVRLPLKEKMTGNVFPFPSRCGKCAACIFVATHDLIGRVAAQALQCAYVDMLTLTYSDARSIEAKVCATIRNTLHIKDFQARYRQRERRAIRRYNKTPAGKLRPVDPSRSYLKFFCAFEQGERGTKRSHWHVLVMAESHFPVPLDEIMTGDMGRTNPHAERVWDFPVITGPRTAKRPPGAKDGSVIDFRVNENANQEFDLWPHGQTNVKRLTHDMNGLYGPVLHNRAQLASAVHYLTSYLKKDIPANTKDIDLARLSAASNRDQEKIAKLYEKNTQRTQSRGLGETFAKSFGVHHASLGMPLDNFNYRLAGYEFYRTPKGVHEFQQKVIGKGASPLVAEAMTDARIVFQMRGKMRQTAFEAYEQANAARRVPKPEHLCGAGYLNGLMERESDLLREKLQSHDWKAIRATRPKDMLPLPDSLPLVHVYKHDENGDLMEPHRYPKGDRPECFREPADRLAERRKQIEVIERLYARAREYDPDLGRVKALVSECYPEDILTDLLYENRPAFERSRFRRERDVQQVEAQLGKFLAAAEEGDPDAQKCYDWLSDYDTISERDAFGLPRGQVHHELVSADRLRRWLNFSDDYSFPWLREQLIEMFCDVHDIASDARVLVAPGNRTLLQKRVFSNQTASFLCPDTKAIIRQKGFERWATRLCRTEQEIERAFAGDLPLCSPNDRAPIFLGKTPFRVS